MAVIALLTDAILEMAGKEMRMGYKEGELSPTPSSVWGRKCGKWRYVADECDISSLASRGSRVRVLREERANSLSLPPPVSLSQRLKVNGNVFVRLMFFFCIPCFCLFINLDFSDFACLWVETYLFTIQIPQIKRPHLSCFSFSEEGGVRDLAFPGASFISLGSRVQVGWLGLGHTSIEPLHFWVRTSAIHYRLPLMHHY